MFRNYFKVAIRNLWRNKAFSAINIFGLAIGIGCSLVIFLFVKNERSYDRFHADSDNIYRVVKDFINDDGSRIPDATTPAPLAPAMQREMPEVISVTRIRPNWGGNYLVKYNDKKFVEEKIYGVDSSFFNVFTFPFVRGNAKTAFAQLRSIVLTESLAKKYFGNEDPIGKTVNVDAHGDLMVSAVVKDVPGNSHLHFVALVSFRLQPGDGPINNWNGYNDYTYVKTTPGINVAAFENKIQAIHDKNVQRSISDFYVQPIKDIHLHSNLKWELEPNSSELYVSIFTIIALAIIVLAAINYINLVTAKATVRAKEIGVRKVIGAMRTSLINQFLFESVITCFIASLVAVALAQLSLPLIQALTGKQLFLFNDPQLIAYLVISVFLLGLISGFLPAIYLSSFKPITVFKTFKLKEGSTLSLRKALVIFQFTVSIVLIIGGLVISQQMNFLLSSGMGMQTAQMVTINNVGALTISERVAFKNQVAKIRGVAEVTSSNGLLPNQFSTARVSVKGNPNEQQLNFMGVSYNFLDVMGIKIKEGRAFSNEFPGDTLTNGIPGGPLDQTIGSIIINERAVKELSIQEPAIGKQILWGRDGDTAYYVNIVGVTKDFHFTSLRNEIKPFGFLARTNAIGTIMLKLDGQNIQQTLAQADAEWRKIVMDRPFEYSFIDERFAKLYEAETLFQKIFIALLVLGVIIACLGLLGLATFAAQQRVKEIGIRKVLGASVTNVVGLLSKDFLKLVLISLVIAVPIGWYALNEWLQDFAYRINLSWWVFPLAGLLAITIAFITISFQAIRAALANPVNSLRTE